MIEKIIVNKDNALENLEKSIKKIDAIYLKRNERDFSYELYHQIRKLNFGKNFGVTSETVKKTFLQVSGETSKNIINESDEIFKDKLIKEHFFKKGSKVNSNRRFPDLLLHDYHNKNNQILAIEIKRNNLKAGILRDLSKLVVYCYGNLVYENGILLLVNPKNEKTIENKDVNTILKNYPKIQIWIVNVINNQVIINNKSKNLKNE